jgi:DNA-binding MarR family transcriptional regulator
MLICNMSIIHKYGKQTLDEMLQPLGLGWQEMSVMMLLEMKPDADLALISTLLQTDKGNVTRLINNMEKKDLIFRDICREDRRCKSLSLTNSGTEKLPAVHEAMAQWEVLCFHGFSQEQIQQYEELNAHVIHNLMNHIQ